MENNNELKKDVSIGILFSPQEINDLLLSIKAQNMLMQKILACFLPDDLQRRFLSDLQAQSDEIMKKYKDEFNDKLMSNNLLQFIKQ